MPKAKPKTLKNKSKIGNKPYNISRRANNKLKPTQQKGSMIQYYKLNYYLNKKDDTHYSVVPLKDGAALQVRDPGKTGKKSFTSFTEWAEDIPVDEEWGIIHYINIPQQIQKSVDDIIASRRAKFTASALSAASVASAASAALVSSMGTNNENDEAAMASTNQTQQAAPVVNLRSIALPIAPRINQTTQGIRASSRGRSQFKSAVSVIQMTNSKKVLSDWFEKIRDLTITLTGGEDIKKIINGKKNALKKAAGELKAKEHSVEKLLIDKTTMITLNNGTRVLKYDKLREYYIVAEFLRSYIDFHHDLENQARDLIKDIVISFQNAELSKITDQKILKWYVDCMKEINNNIYKKTGNVNQDYCVNALSNIIDKLLSFEEVKKHITWIPATEQESIVQTFSDLRISSKNYNITPLFDKLREKGVRSCFAESITGGYYNALVHHSRTDNTYLRNRTLSISEWDGGSGFSGSGMNTNSATLSIFPAIKSTTDPFYMFGGVMEVSVNGDNNELTCRVSGYSEIIQLSGKTHQKLSLNRLLNTAKLPLLRGKKDQMEERKENLSYLKGNFTKDTISQQQKKILTLLKTWTDFSQIRKLSQYHGDKPTDLIAVCMNDYCLNATARMYGIPFVMLNTKNSIILYCYDLYADKNYFEVLEENRITTVSAVLHNITNLISFSDVQFRSFVAYLNLNQNIANNPALYFAYFHIKNMWATITVNMTKEVKRLDEIKTEITSQAPISDSNHQFIHLFPTTVKEWFSQFISAETLINGINETVNGIQQEMKLITMSENEKSWIEHYRAISTLVDNTIKDTDPIKSQACRICVLVIAYRSNGSTEEQRNLIYLALRQSLNDAVRDTPIKSGVGGDYVSSEQIRDIFLPISFTNIMNLFELLRIVKMGQWSLPSHTEIQKEIKPFTPHICDLINALDVYRCILDVPITADCLENGLIALYLISNESQLNTCDAIITRSMQLLNHRWNPLTFEQIQARVITGKLQRTVSINFEDVGSRDRTKCSQHYLNGERSLLPIRHTNIPSINQDPRLRSANSCSTGFCGMGAAAAAAATSPHMSHGGTRKRVIVGLKRFHFQKRKHQRRTHKK